jgi:hypothetical protein
VATLKASLSARGDSGPGPGDRLKGVASANKLLEQLLERSGISAGALREYRDGREAAALAVEALSGGDT